MAVPLEATGFLVGVEMLAIATALAFRHKYVDGYRYPWQIPMTFYALGSGVLLVVSEYSVAGLVSSMALTFAGYVLLGLVGVLAMHYFWTVYPARHEESPCLVRGRHQNR